MGMERGFSLEGSEGVGKGGKSGEKVGGYGINGRKSGKKEGYKVGFWNVVRLENKDGEFCKKLGEWEIIFLSETWLQRKGWERVRSRLPKGFSWEMQKAGKKE